MVDQQAIIAVESSVYAAGLPTDVGAALTIEFDGPRALEQAVQVRFQADEPPAHPYQLCR